MNRTRGRVTTALLARRSQALKRHLREAVAGDGVGVHQARVASRRLREAVPVLATGLKKTGANKARKKIRRVTKALGCVRELDVTISLLDELARQEAVPRIALEHVRARVVQEQERRRPTMLKRLAKVNVGKLDRRLGTLSEALDKAQADGWRETLAARLLKRAKRLREAVEAAGQMYEAERLHVVRIAAKKLRYAMELAAETGVKAAVRPVRTIKRAQDTLGRLHDLQVLQSYVGDVQAKPAETSVPDSGLEMLSRLLEDNCRHLHATYVSGVPALLETADLTRSAIVPQLARARRAKPALKMDLRAARPKRASRNDASKAAAADTPIAVNEGK
jgi:CHAD domain-containing protein